MAEIEYERIPGVSPTQAAGHRRKEKYRASISKRIIDRKLSLSLDRFFNQTYACVPPCQRLSICDDIRLGCAPNFVVSKEETFGGSCGGGRSGCT
mmetsp:Transcript_24528/g.73503  ORF Transcript_24528/g.73503 Transcript_24528/m.73503 type:complete len:95 (-) Transcript_24528:16-300(-)